MTNGRKSTQKHSVTEAIFATLAFFSLYDIPLKKQRIFELLYKLQASEDEVLKVLQDLVAKNKIKIQNGLYALNDINQNQYNLTQQEISKRWKRVDKYFWLLSIIPYIENLSVINSLVMGNANQESDIDFFVITKPCRLYFVRSMVIVLFRLLGVYKTRKKIKDQFCFGFYVTSDNLNLKDVLIEPSDPLFAFWFASFAPLFGEQTYKNFVEKNTWIASYFPNFKASMQGTYYRDQSTLQVLIKKILEVILWIPATLLEPLARMIHIRHTFNLPENHLPTSTTIANQNMLKLHAIDPRKEVRERFVQALAKETVS